MAINREDWVRSVVPSGTVIAFAGATPPTGWLLCNGATISRAAYPALFTAISVAHGSGDGSTTFHLPDYRGRFLRGVANGSVNDPDRASRTAANTGGNGGDAVGSVQADAMQGHRHDIPYSSSSATAAYPEQNGSNLSLSITSGDPITDGLNGTPRTTSESRPKNANVNYIIKA